MSYGVHGLTHPVRKKLHGLRGDGFIVLGRSAAEEER
jgi:hypothetical protein